MRRCGRALIEGALILCVCTYAPAAEKATVATLIEQLDDREYDQREAAAKQLAECGAAAIDPLSAAAQGESPEVASRAVQLLERLLRSDDVATIDAADQALVEVAESDHPQAIALANAALDRNATVREERAVARIRELGGQVQYDVPKDEFRRPLVEPSEATLQPQTIVLKHRWQGGVAGLSQLKKLKHLQGLQLYVIEGCGVSLAEAQSLASVLPDLVVHQRGVYLGIQAQSEVSPCVVDKVPSKGPAAAAGIRPGDMVLSFEEQPVRQFIDLVQKLTHHKIGDQVTIRVARAGEILDLKVTLDEWNLPPVANEDDELPPPAGQPFPPPILPVPQAPPIPQQR